MTFPIRKSARKLTGIVKITIPEVFPEMKPLGNIIIFPIEHSSIVEEILCLPLLSSKGIDFVPNYR